MLGQCEVPGCSHEATCAYSLETDDGVWRSALVCEEHATETPVYEHQKWSTYKLPGYFTQDGTYHDQFVTIGCYNA